MNMTSKTRTRRHQIRNETISRADNSSEPCTSVTGLFIAMKEFTVRLNWADGGYWKTAYRQGHITEYQSFMINGNNVTSL